MTEQTPKIRRLRVPDINVVNHPDSPNSSTLLFGP
jgi:hypothetical protein